MMDRWDEKNPYEKLLLELMPKRVNDKKEEKVMKSRELMNQMKKGQLVKVPMFPNDIWRIEAFDYIHGRVGVRSTNEDKPHFLRWFAPEELNTDICQGRRLDGYPAYCMADIAEAKRLINEVFGAPGARTPARPRRRKSSMMKPLESRWCCGRMARRPSSGPLKARSMMHISAIALLWQRRCMAPTAL